MTERTPTSWTRRAIGAAAAVTVGSLVVAGCGKADLKHEADAAQANLSSARSASFTVHLDDPRGELARSSSDQRSARIARDASITLTIDPVGDRRLGSITAAPKAADPVAALRDSGAFELTYRNAGHAVVALRSVNGVLFLRLDPAQYQSLTGKPLGSGSAPAAGPLGPAAAALGAGKWLSLDLPAAYAKVKGSGLLPPAGGATATDPRQASALGRAMVAAVQGHGSYHSRSDHGSTLIDVRINARAALSAVVDVLEDPAYASLLRAGGPRSASSLASAKAALAKIPAGDVTGTVTLTKGHVRQVAVNLASLAALSTDPDAKQVKSARLVVDVNDRAPALSAPAADQVVRVDAIVGAALSQLSARRVPTPIN